MTEPLEDHAELINQHMGGYNRAMGLTFVTATAEELVAELVIEPHHLQPYGLVHGGVYSGMIETLCSTGAAVNEMPKGNTTVGLDNATSFLRAVREGTLRCTATPLVRGRRTHVWEAHVHDDRGRLVASGRVRLLVLEAGAEAAGIAVELAQDPSE
ncbi:MAG: PaaI family thioesterase [bacterium]